VISQEEKKDQREERDGKGREAEDGGEERAESVGAHGGGEVPGVLSIWTERRKPGEVCQELGVAWSVLSQWAGAGNGGDAVGTAASGLGGERSSVKPTSSVCWSGRTRRVMKDWSGGWLTPVEESILQKSPPSQRGCGRLEYRRRTDDLNGDSG